MNSRSGFSALWRSFIFCAVTAASVCNAFTLTPGTLIGFNADFDQELRSYSFTGTLLDTLDVTGLPNTPIGVAIIGDRLFVGDVLGFVGEVDLTTGAVFNLFDGFGNEAIGDNGTNLLTYNYSDGTMREFTTNGTLIDTVPLVTGGTGIDGTASRIYLGMHDIQGDVLEFDAAGNLLDTIVTGLPGGTVSALAFDPTDSTIWVATGFGSDEIYHFDLAGNLLTSFPANATFINGLDVVPLVPEPGSLALAGVALLGWLNCSFRPRRY